MSIDYRWRDEARVVFNNPRIDFIEIMYWPVLLRDPSASFNSDHDLVGAPLPQARCWAYVARELDLRGLQIDGPPPRLLL